MSRQPRVLLVTPTYTHPQNQGNSARIFAMGEALRAAGIRVDLLYYQMDWPGDEGFAAMKSHWDGFYLLKPSPLRRQSFATCWGIDDWCGEALPEEVARLQAQNGYDAVIVNYVWLSRAFEGAGDALRILDTHDLFGDRHNLARRSGLMPNWYFTSIAEENRGFDRADIVLAIQSEEAAIIARRTKAKTLLLSHPIAPRPLRAAADEAEVLACFGYIGSANPWNQLAVASLDQAFAGRSLDWLLAGRICDLPIAQRARPLRLGQIEDVAQFYGAVACSLNPMPDATGLKIKTIEALAHDCPIIGTRAAFAGLAPRHGFHLCANAAEMADAAEEFARSPALRPELRAAGRLLFNEYLSDLRNQYHALCHAIGAKAKQTGVAA